jgi:hypothetical protein
MMLPSALVLALEEDVLVEVPPRSPIALSMNDEIIDSAEVAVELVLPEVLLSLELLVAPES